MLEKIFFRKKGVRMINKKDKLVRGSIRAFRDACFYEERGVQQMNISYNGISTVLHVTTLPKGLKEIFVAAEISYEPGVRVESRIKTGIDALQLDNIESAGESHLRLKFSGLTETELKGKLNHAKNWLNDNNISFGEPDGKVACIFKCLTNEQLELDKY